MAAEESEFWIVSSEYLKDTKEKNDFSRVSKLPFHSNRIATLPQKLQLEKLQKKNTQVDSTLRLVHQLAVMSQILRVFARAHIVLNL